MADTYSQIYVHIVFAVRNRSGSILPEWEEELYRFVTGIVQMKNQKMIEINGMPDHIHFLIGMRPTCCLSDLVREIKKLSTQFVTEEKLSLLPFHWQKGFGAFTCSHSNRDIVANYIKNQKKHHSGKSLKTEYQDFLKTNEIDFKEEFLFDSTDR